MPSKQKGRHGYREKYLDIFSQASSSTYSHAVKLFASKAPKYLQITIGRILEYMTEAQVSRTLEKIAEKAQNMKPKELDDYLRSASFDSNGPKLSESITLQLTPEEYMALQQVAEFQGMSPSGCMRRILLGNTQFAHTYKYLSAQLPSDKKA